MTDETARRYRHRHLFTGIGTVTVACQKVLVPLWPITTVLAEVTCGNCKRTKVYKHRLKQETER